MTWVDNDNVALLTDLYELTMLQAYWREQMHDEAVFSLFVRKLPETRNYLVACGLDDALSYLETLRFTAPALEYLRTTGAFAPDFLDWLERFRFTGNVYAVAEGTPLFENEPLLEIVAPLPEAQIVESFLMNQVHFQTVVASKGARVVSAARGRRVIDFGMRRMHGADAAIKAARALYIAGVDATSNVLAGRAYGIPIAGTMAHSYIQAHDSEIEAFRAFASLYPETILLVDTYDTMEGVDNVIRLARELGASFRVKGIRLDSGDLAALAREARRRLDSAGLQDVTIFASGGLDERSISRLVEEAPEIQGFGVGTRMGVSRDAPALDMAYKITSYAGRGRLKLSKGKSVLPGRKQVFREEEDGLFTRDTLARDGESLPGRPLLHLVMEGGKRLSPGRAELPAIRARAEEEIAKLPERVRALPRAEPAYPVAVSPALQAFRDRIAADVRARFGSSG